MVEATQYNPGQALAPKVQASQEQLMIKLLNDGITNNLAAIEKTIEEFKVKTSIYSTHPLRAKIGKKEGLKTDQRYFVFEMEQDRAGNIKAKRKGVVRASRNITDNRTVSSGKSGTSRFYQVAGGRLDEGMLLQQRNDAGLALTLGGSKGGFGGFDARLDINISRLLGANMPSMIKLYVEGGYDNTKSDIVIADQSSIHTTSGFTRFGGGLAKEICFAHYFKLQPYAGIGLESTTDKDNKDISLSSFYGRAGILFGLNLRHNIQFVYSLGTYSPFGKITDKENNSILINNESSWKAAFDRGGSTGTFGIRFEF
jgi:hypothetical protein